MDYLYFIFWLWMGLIFGSFLSVIVSRLDVKGGILTGRSECPKCLSRLKWYDLIPVFSFLILRAKCRSCKNKISFVYPAMEIAVGLSFSFYCGINGPCLSLLNFYELAIIFLLLVLLFFDYTQYILPDKVIFSALGIVLVYTSLFNGSFLLSSLLTGLLISLFFGIIYMISHGEWIGFGDVKLVLLIGFFLGYPLALWSLLGAIWLGALWGIALMTIGKADLKTALPFGSFISASAVFFIIFKKYASLIFSLF